MSYEVRCECGKAHSVSAADAGSVLACACGRTVEVPPVHLLQPARGSEAVPLLAKVRAAVTGGLLPGTRACSCCGTETNGSCRVKVLYARVPNTGGTSQAELVGCLLFGWLPALLMRAHRKSEGDEEAIVVPLPVCDACRPKLAHPNALRTAVRRIPDYAALLDYYPKAELSIFG